MDESWEKWLFDMEMDDCHLFNEYNNMNSFEEGLISNGENTHVATADNNNTMNNSSLEENAAGFSPKQHASSEEPPLFSSSMSHILSSEECSTVVPPNNIPKETHDDQHSKENREELQNRKSKRCRSSSQIQDHIIAERKRRENLTKMFIALSAVIPGLKKMDKASIVNNAINYVKYLQKSVKDLEEENKKRKVESVICLKNDKSSNIEGTKRFPIVEARVLAKDVFIRVVCDNREDIALKLLAKLEAHHNLSLVCSNVLPFGNSTLNITITAQVDHEFSMTKDDLVKKLIEDLLEVF